MSRENERWYELSETRHVPTPALVFYPERMERNVARVLEIAGSVQRLCPHVKTHKSPGVTALLMRHGVSEFKCATLGEARMLAESAVPELIVAYPLTGPSITTLMQLVEAYPATTFRTVTDCVEGVDELAAAAQASGRALEVLLDIDPGMGRTGVTLNPESQQPGEASSGSPSDRHPVVATYRHIAECSYLRPAGLHVYDGHIHESDPLLRRQLVQPIIREIERLRRHLQKAGLPVPRVVAGGTPTFPCYAAGSDFALSPGTCFLHDHQYQEAYPDLGFHPAALILGRVVSVPSTETFTVDVGAKAIATDPPGPRGVILNVPGAEPLAQSEEHWVFRASATAGAGAPAVPRRGSVVYILPRHICPTVDRHAFAYVAGPNGNLTGVWPITGRNRIETPDLPAAQR